MSIDPIGSRFAAPVFGVLPYAPPEPKTGPGHGAHPRCWLCGGEAGSEPWHRPTAIAPTFTNHNLAAEPTSDSVCQACMAVSSGETWARYVAAHPEHGLKCSHPLSWRTYSHAVTLTGAEHPNRARWRALLLDPPQPPFLFVLSESSQKHLLFRSRVSFDRDRFVMQVEEDRVWVERAAFAECLHRFEALLEQGCRREEIVSGRYNPGRRPASLRDWHAAEAAFAPWRATQPDSVRLAVHCGRDPRKEG